MRRSFRFLAVVTCALPLACTDTSMMPTATAPPPVPSLSANPASNGSVIARYNDWVGFAWFAWYDQSVNAIAVHATGDIPAMCVGGDPAFLPSDWKVVGSGNFENLYRMVVKYPELYVFIVDGAWETWDICKPPIMRGMATAKNTDNDRFGQGPGANAWGFVVNGQVSDANGQAYRYGGHLRAVISADGSYHETGSIDLKPLN